jgi:TetR/AcrR family transcriptional repressor of nem operon
MDSVELTPKATEIANCAQALLAVRGYNGFSYSDIAESVHISKPSVHHHFPSKAVLVQTVVRRYREEARGGMAALARQVADPLARLKAYTGYWDKCIRDASSSFCVCAMLGSELTAIPEEVAQEVRGHFQDLQGWLASLLQEGARQGIFRFGGTAKAEAMALMATVHGSMLAARVYGDADMFTVPVRQVLRRLTGGA